jgi:lia operon protein LiaG
MKSLTMDVAPSRARSLITALLVVLGLLGLAFAADSMVAAFATAAPTDLSHRVTLTGSDIAVYNLAGQARLEAGSGSAVQVTITQQGRDADELKIEQSPIRGRTTFRVVYPGNRIIYPEMGRGSNTSIRVRDDGTFGGNNNHGDWFGSGDNVRISGSGSGTEAHADLAITIPRGQKFSLFLAAGEVTVTNIDGELHVDTGSGPVSSSHTRGDLSIDTGSGEINVGGAEGDVKLDTGSGDVNVTGVHGDELNVDTGSGTIRARDIEVSNLALATGSGDVEAVNLKADRIAVDTGSGSVELGLFAMAHSIAVDTGSGDVTLRVPSGAGADISFETGSGGFDYEGLPVQLHKLEQGTYRGRLGSGGAQVQIETGSGDLRLAANSRR